jgi:hypothetical protein
MDPTPASKVGSGVKQSRQITSVSPPPYEPKPHKTTQQQQVASTPTAVPSVQPPAKTVTSGGKPTPMTKFASFPQHALKPRTITLKPQIELHPSTFGLPTGTPPQIRTHTSKLTATTSTMDRFKLRFSTIIIILFRVGQRLRRPRRVGMLVGRGVFSIRSMSVRHPIPLGPRMDMRGHRI